MKKIIIAFAVLVSGIAFAHENAANFAKKAALMVPGDVGEGIEFFKGSWTDAKKKADKEDKLIFLDAYASWCGPCKMMARNTFTDSKVGDYFNKNFVNFKMDMEKHEDGPRLSKKYGLQAYPTLYFVDENEKKVAYSIGALSVKDLLAFGRSVL